MNLRNCLQVAAIALTPLLLSGCAIIFSAANQNVGIKSATPGAKIMFDGDSVGTGSAEVRLNKYRVYNTFTAEKEGYKSRNYCVTLNKYSPTIGLAALDALAVIIPTAKIASSAKKDASVEFGNDVLIIPGLYFASLLLTDLKHVKTHRYDNNQTIPALEPYQTRGEKEKYLLVNNTDVDIKASNQKTVSYGRLSKYYNATAKQQSGKSYATGDVKISDAVFTGTLNYTLKKMKFIDTTNHIFPNINNSLYLNATIKSVTFHEVKSPYVNSAQYRSHPREAMPNHLFAVELSIDWDVLDFYKQKLVTIRTVEKSDLFTVAYGADKSEMETVVYNAMKDNMDFSIMNLRRQLADKKLLSITDIKEDITALELPRPQAAARTKESFKNSCVSIKVDDGFGSGAILSDDGYIITNYHLIAGTKKVTVTFSDSTTEEAEVVRKNTESDMALLKVKKTGLTPFLLSEDKDPEIGGDVWAVGVAGNLELGISLSHGILAGVRKSNGLTMLQTDASLNKGNSGSALVNDKGAVLGIVSLKIMGRGVEGIGFALSAKDVMEKLGLKYK